LYRGYFINLDRNITRLAAITAHLKGRGVSDAYERFPAVDGRLESATHKTTLDAGELGIWLTQENLLRANRNSNDHLHIIEDDTNLAQCAKTVLPDLMGVADTNIAGWDLFFTSALIPLEVRRFKQLAKQWESFKATEAIELFPLKDIYRGGTGSFFVNAKSIDKYLSLISGKWSLGTPIDLYLRQLINDGRLNAYGCIPFLSSQSEEGNQSDIRGQLNSSREAYLAYCSMFYVDADHGRIKQELTRLSEGAEHSIMTDIFLRALSFTLSDKFQSF
jgi:hypothetical protein